jgi:CyaY protein
MTPSEYQRQADATMQAIEDTIETVADAGGIDADMERAGPVLNIDLEPGGRIVVNQQAPMQQIWVAARSGGFHYGYVDGRWVDTRSGEELFAALSRLITAQSGQAVVLSAPD